MNTKVARRGRSSEAEAARSRVAARERLLERLGLDENTHEVVCWHVLRDGAWPGTDRRARDADRDFEADREVIRSARESIARTLAHLAYSEDLPVPTVVAARRDALDALDAYARALEAEALRCGGKPRARGRGERIAAIDRSEEIAFVRAYLTEASRRAACEVGPVDAALLAVAMGFDQPLSDGKGIISHASGSTEWDRRLDAWRDALRNPE